MKIRPVGPLPLFWRRFWWNRKNPDGAVSTAFAVSATTLILTVILRVSLENVITLGILGGVTVWTLVRWNTVKKLRNAGLSDKILDWLEGLKEGDPLWCHFTSDQSKNVYTCPGTVIYASSSNNRLRIEVEGGFGKEIRYFTVYRNTGALDPIDGYSGVIRKEQRSV